MGPGAGAEGGKVIGEGTPGKLEGMSGSKIGPFLRGEEIGSKPEEGKKREVFSEGRISISTGNIHTVKPLEADFPKAG